MAISLHLSLPALLAAGAGVILLYIAWRWRPFQRYPGATTWTFVLISVAFWDISYGIALTIHNPGMRWLFEIPVMLGRSLSIPLILLFALQYTGREKLATSNWMYALFGFYAVTFLLSVTNPIHQIMWVGYHISPVYGAAAVDYTPRGYYVVAGASYLVILLAIVFFIDTIARQRELFGTQGLALVVALAIPSIANVVWLFRLGPTRHLDTTPIGHIAIASLLTYALFQEDMFDVVPATRHRAEQAALDDLAIAVISVTTNGQIVNANARAIELFGVDRDALLLEQIDAKLPMEIPPDEERFSLTDPFGNRNQFTVGISEIVSERGNSIGYTISLQNITAERRRQQRLKVLNRVLRHNLRNELNLILGYTSAMSAQTSGTEEYAREIGAVVDGLLGISQKARDIEQIIDRDSNLHAAKLGEVIQTAVDEVTTQYPAAKISVSAPGDGPSVNKRVLVPVLQELIENACRHNDADVATVDITVEVTNARDYPITISVRDNGPGIPEDELLPLQEGTETPLKHGSGLGLWLVEWGISRLGGTIQFDANEPRGTVVWLRLPTVLTPE